MTAVASEIEIIPLEQVPSRVGGTRQELNQLWYGPSEVLVARRTGEGDAEGVLGAVRLAMRERPAKPHGLIADLIIDESLREAGLPEQLIRAAEARLKELGAEKIDAVIVDGQGWASYFYRCGYWSSRRMVVLTWDLETRKPVERSHEFQVRQVDHPDAEELARFIVNSYQPYFRWWKEPREDQKWLRVELQPEDLLDQYERAAEEVRQRVMDLIRLAGSTSPQTFFLAYKNGELVGLCDAKDAPEGEDTFDWCVLVTRQDGGKGIGST
ncbi:MAG TPA: GNAT family N-acetyltransferase, partial [Chloroflexota bacterium]|nr:GNAT family N-acetyltransferase [Chloroflexota bacterium]